MIDLGGDSGYGSGSGVSGQQDEADRNEATEGEHGGFCIVFDSALSEN